MATERQPSLDGAVTAIRSLADGTRLRLLMLLSEGEANVGGLSARTGLPQPTVSHHLGLLRTAGVVRTRRQGKSVFYGLAAESRAPGSVRVVASGALITISSVAP